MIIKPDGSVRQTQSPRSYSNRYFLSLEEYDTTTDIGLWDLLDSGLKTYYLHWKWDAILVIRNNSWEKSEPFESMFNKLLEWDKSAIEYRKNLNSYHKIQWGYSEKAFRKEEEEEK